MKSIINKFKKLDTLYKGGVIFIALFFVPVIICLINDLFTNGSNLL